MIGVYQSEGINSFGVVERALKKNLNLESCDAGSFKLPSHSYNPQRKQYDASTIIKALAPKSKPEFDMKIGMVDVDIYARNMNFIFGMADPLRKTALVSTHRLAGNKLTERISKEVVHELGHLLSLGHCSHSYCVMYFSNTITDTDNKCAELCTNCRDDIG